MRLNPSFPRSAPAHAIQARFGYNVRHMAKQSNTSVVATARAALANMMPFEEFLTKLGPKGRVHAERHVAACELEPEKGPRHAEVWKRLAQALITLAPHAPKVNGQQSVQFYIPDGKYKMQVFALEDLRDGKITVYCGNVLADAVGAAVLTPRNNPSDGANLFQIKGTEDWLTIEELDGKSPNPSPFYKDMLGWNRKAVRITIPSDASDAQLGAVETLGALTARPWAPTLVAK